ncbi:hypothetical protein JR316_0005462 [Psilocybe cubensis]|uniref:Uncharacterized protein n=2 Tax=Psilocybe cubensis TaxID=181762 RepID=A0A8H7XJ58_PSICU|nr:hypothetical protein JR316_0005462 [Psilocybe cubensis]KAH9483356.1 hypothetical protein JR316_0005462 [Psilocybe cubensis]
MLSLKLLLPLVAVSLTAINALAYPTSTKFTKTFPRSARGDDIVNTPSGPIHSSNVHVVPHGSLIQHEASTVNVIAPNGTTIFSLPSNKAQRGLNATQPRDSLARRALQSGYVELAFWGNTAPSPISTFSTLWSVPNVPENVDGQLLYIFNALEPQSFDGILQPVLQFGVSPAGGGNYWSVASWWLYGSDVFATPVTPVSVGQTLVGVMTLQSTSTSGGSTSYNYNSVFTGIPASSLSITSPEELTITFEALEIYGASGPTDLPRGRTTMRAIDIVNQDGSRPPVSWEVTADTNERFSVNVVSNATPNGQVDLFYPLQ